jgi:hypothetical protein
MGYDDAESVWVSSFDKRDFAGCVGVCVTARVLQCLFEMLQASGGVCGPHQQMMPQPSFMVDGSFAAFDDVELEASWSQEQGGIM